MPAKSPVICRREHEMYWTGRTKVRGHGDYRTWYQRKCRRGSQVSWALTLPSRSPAT
jgi:hypothetical protein